MDKPIYSNNPKQADYDALWDYLGEVELRLSTQRAITQNVKREIDRLHLLRKSYKAELKKRREQMSVVGL